MESFLKLDDKKKQQIINSAMKEFSDKGYKKASTNEIAKNASISKGSLFNYFLNKEELFKYMYELSICEMEKKLYSKLENQKKDFFEVIRNISYLKIDYLMEYPLATEFIIKAYSDDDFKNISYNSKLDRLNYNFYNYMDKYADISNARDGFILDELLSIVRYISNGYANKFKSVFNDRSKNKEEQFIKSRKIADECLALIERLLVKDNKLGE